MTALTAYARNAGLDRCHGDIIAFLDPDDAFCANTFSVMTVNANPANWRQVYGEMIIKYEERMLE